MLVVWGGGGGLFQGAYVELVKTRRKKGRKGEIRKKKGPVKGRASGKGEVAFSHRLSEKA